MAISDVCKLQVKKEIDHYIETEGISRNEASKKLAAFYTEILGIEIKPETIRKKDLRARDEVGTNVPTGDWPECRNANTGKCVSRLPVVRASNGKPAKHGLCRICRRNEKKEKKMQQIRTELEAAKKEFEQIPVDPESDKSWNELSDRMVEFLEVEEEMPCGKVSEETLKKINSWSEKFSDCLLRVLAKSECPRMEPVD